MEKGTWTVHLLYQAPARVGEASEGGEMGVPLSSLTAAQSITLSTTSYNITQHCTQGDDFGSFIGLSLPPRTKASCERKWWTI